jgi:hypothetical protein
MDKDSTAATSEEVAAQLASIDWDDYWPKLEAHVLLILRRRYGVRGNKDELSERCRECVQTALYSVFAEDDPKKRRYWYKAKSPDMFRFLCSVMDSQINNAFNTKRPDAPTGEEVMLDGFQGQNGNVSPDEFPTDLRESVVQELQAHGASEDEILVFHCMADGVMKPESIRSDLGMCDKDFHNTSRRLDRRIRQVRTKLGL